MDVRYRSVLLLNITRFIGATKVTRNAAIAIIIIHIIPINQKRLKLILFTSS